MRWNERGILPGRRSPGEKVPAARRNGGEKSVAGDWDAERLVAAGAAVLLLDDDAEHPGNRALRGRIGVDHAEAADMD